MRKYPQFYFFLSTQAHPSLWDYVEREQKKKKLKKVKLKVSKLVAQCRTLKKHQQPRSRRQESQSYSSFTS